MAATAGHRYGVYAECLAARMHALLFVFMQDRRTASGKLAKINRYASAFRNFGGDVFRCRFHGLQCVNFFAPHVEGKIHFPTHFRKTVDIRVGVQDAGVEDEIFPIR